jgi:8-oxo-dGTP pyrophosphatase MutT (NUDIX family)
MTNKSFQYYLQTHLQIDLPGRQAQEKMAPHPVNGAPSKSHYEPGDDDFRNNSVLVPIILWNDEPEVVLTLRTESINHGGQLSFPGGGKEGHETVEETALREAQEEIGLHPETVHIAGHLSNLYVGHSFNMVVPVVGFLMEKQDFTPNPNEVDEIIHVPLSQLSDENHIVKEEWNLRGVPYTVPYWDVHRVPLWGATAMMLSELVELYKEFLVNH